MNEALSKTVPLLRVPTLPDRGAWIDSLETRPGALSFGQRVFMSRIGARVYAGVRENPMMRLLTGKSFAQEVEALCAELGIGERSTVLDVPCGQGNFLVHLARRARSGVVVGLDLSGTMLDLARERATREGLANVALVRGSALELPFRDGVFDAVSACGGLHLYPDVDQAIREMRRVLKPGGWVAGLTIRQHGGRLRGAAERRLHRLFGTRGFDFDALGLRFERAGFGEYRWSGRGVVSWFSAK